MSSLSSIRTEPHLRSQGRRGQFTDNAGQQPAGVGDQVGGEELISVPCFPIYSFSWATVDLLFGKICVLQVSCIY